MLPQISYPDKCREALETRKMFADLLTGSINGLSSLVASLDILYHLSNLGFGWSFSEIG